jgi:plasmid stabilization system protein ParE
MTAVLVTKAARRELDEAAAYYDAERAGLGERLHAEFHSAAARIAEHPLLYPKAARDARKCNVRKFPYAIVYRFREGVVTIVAFMHLHRRPGYWSGRVS